MSEQKEPTQEQVINALLAEHEKELSVLQQTIDSLKLSNESLKQLSEKDAYLLKRAKLEINREINVQDQSTHSAAPKVIYTLRRVLSCLKED